MATAGNNQFKLSGPKDEDYQSLPAVTLSCHLSPEISAVNLEIRWFKETDCVCLYKNRQVTEGRGYEGRVSLFTQELQRGNVSLQIRDCSLSDLGYYLCRVTNGDTTEECTVGVFGPFSRITEDISSVEETDEGQTILISQEARKWTEEERIKMKESALLIELSGQNQQLMEKDKHIQEKEKLLTKNTETLQMKDKMLEEKEKLLQETKDKLEQMTKESELNQLQLKDKDARLENQIKLLREKEALLENTVKEVDSSKKQLDTLRKELQEKDIHLADNVKTLQMKENELEVKEKLLSEINDELSQKTKTLENHRIQIEEMEKRLVEKDEELKEIKQQVNAKEMKLKEKDATIKEHLEIIDQRDSLLKETKERFESVNKQLKDKDTRLENQIKLLREKETLLENTVKEVDSSNKQLDTLRKELQDKSSKLQEMMIRLEEQKTELSEKDKQLEEKEKLLSERNTQLMEREKQVEEKDRLLEERNKQLQERTDPDSSVPARRRNSKELEPPKFSEETPESAVPLRQNMSGESSSSASPVSVPVAELRLVLLGRTGCGKSAAGNIILGREERSQAGASTVRQQSESRQGEVAGRQVTVVDTPDWFCPGLSLEELRQDVGLCVRLSAPGPHVFLLVLPVKQSTGEERGMLEKMEEIFGERCWRNTMILFTVTDEVQEKNIEEFIQSGKQEVQRLVEKCGNRFHCLSIKESGDTSQTSELLEKIEKMVEGNREKFYSSEMYLEIESQIRAMETRIINEREEKREMQEREIKQKLEKEVQNSLKKIEGAVQEHEGEIKQLNHRTTELERRIKEERDEEQRGELERELGQEIERRAEMEEKVKRLKEKRERERREMEERHRQEMEEIRETYEGEARMDTERNLMKIILPELQRNIMVSKSKMQDEFSRQMEEKNRELETLKLRYSDLTKTHSLLEEVYEKTVRSSSDSERAAPAEGESKGFSQRFKDLFH